MYVRLLNVNKYVYYILLMLITPETHCMPIKICYNEPHESVASDSTVRDYDGWTTREWQNLLCHTFLKDI